MKVILDANVVVAAFVTKGTCHEVYRLCPGIHELVTSDAILTEAERILTGKLKAPQDAVARHMGEFGTRAVRVDPAPVPRTACRDPNDLQVLGTALAARADLLVTGDDDLLEVREYKGTVILRPGDALRKLDIPRRSRGPERGWTVAERPRRYARPTRRGRTRPG